MVTVALYNMVKQIGVAESKFHQRNSRFLGGSGDFYSGLQGLSNQGHALRFLESGGHEVVKPDILVIRQAVIESDESARAVDADLHVQTEQEFINFRDLVLDLEKLENVKNCLSSFRKPVQQFFVDFHFPSGFKT